MTKATSLLKALTVGGLVLGLTSCGIFKPNPFIKPVRTQMAPPISDEQNYLTAKLLDMREVANIERDSYFRGVDIDSHLDCLNGKVRDVAICPLGKFYNYDVKKNFRNYPRPGYFLTYGQMLMRQKNDREAIPYLRLEIKFYPESYFFIANYLKHAYNLNPAVLDYDEAEVRAFLAKKYEPGVNYRDTPEYKKYRDEYDRLEKLYKK